MSDGEGEKKKEKDETEEARKVEIPVMSIAKILQLQRSTELSQLQWYSVAIAIV